jgi:hypothetical protein
VAWNGEAARRAYFMSGEDLTTQAGLAVQQDLALVNLLGITHVERNGHHYVNGMAALPPAEQQAFPRRASRPIVRLARRGCGCASAMAASRWRRSRRGLRERGATDWHAMAALRDPTHLTGVNHDHRRLGSSCTASPAAWA